MSASETARHGALLVRESERGVLAVVGPDRATWLNGVVTPEVANLRPGQATFGLLLGKTGKIHTDFYAAAASDRLLLAVAPGTAEQARSELDRMLVMEDAEVIDRSEELECLFLHGARAAEFAATVADQAAVAELDHTGFGGALLFVARASAAPVQQKLEAAGASLGSPAEWLELRLERGIGVFGSDYGPGDNPHEAALDRKAVSWSKGCYLGQEAVFMQDARGKLKRRLAWLNVAGPAPEAGTPLLSSAGEVVGEV
ncbi:MAG TPA: hypothetical protein VGK41_08250, partial [Solirubrobacterales bacterium]